MQSGHPLQIWGSTLVLPFKCGHKWHVKKLIGKSKDGKFQTGPSASYPAGLCKFLAELISSVLRMGENELQPMRDVSTVKSMGAASMVTDEEKPTVKSMGAASMVTDDAKVVTDDDSGATAMSTDVIGGQEFPPKPLGVTGASEGTCVGENAGQPIWVEWAGRETEFVDGFGLCSPNLYRPEQRGASLRDEAKKLAKDVYELVERFVVSEIGDVRDKSFRLAVGQFSESPFSDQAMARLRREWSRLLPRPDSALVVPEGQPLLLEMMSQTLEIFGDPDWMILTADKESFATGVPVGFDNPLPKGCPWCFRKEQNTTSWMSQSSWPCPKPTGQLKRIRRAWMRSSRRMRLLA